MNRDELRSLQAPLKQRYRDDPERRGHHAQGRGPAWRRRLCSVETGRALVEAGLHPATGGSGLQACSGDMLLQALVACAGVTLSAVATSMGIELRGGRLAPKAISTSAARSAWRRTRRWVPGDPARDRARLRCGARRATEAARADRALLRRLPDAAPTGPASASRSLERGCASASSPTPTACSVPKRSLAARCRAHRSCRRHRRTGGPRRTARDRAADGRAREQ